MPESSDLAIFVLTDDRRMNRTDYFTPCACAQGNNTEDRLEQLDAHGQSTFVPVHVTNILLVYIKEMMELRMPQYGHYCFVVIAIFSK